jgi:hypothetical protein
MDPDTKKRTSTITNGITTIQDCMNTNNHTGTDNINTRMNNLNDDRRIYDWNLKFTIILDNHLEKVHELQPPKKTTTSTWTKTTSTSNRLSPIHPATTSTTKQLMTTLKIFRSTETPPTWKNSSNTKRRKDKQSTFKNQREADPRSHKIEKRSPSTTSKKKKNQTIFFYKSSTTTKNKKTKTLQFCIYFQSDQKKHKFDNRANS